MYSKPTLQRFGTFREITQAGIESGFGDTSSYYASLTSKPESTGGGGAAGGSEFTGATTS